MTSLENRNSSALFKRAEQLKRWSESDTNSQDSEPKRKSQRIQFTDGCVFLAACAASDKDEVERLQKRGADIDTANIDGLTALHQVRNLTKKLSNYKGFFIAIFSITVVKSKILNPDQNIFDNMSHCQSKHIIESSLLILIF